MMKIWSISGTPLTIQTITFDTDLTALKRLIEQNAMGTPNGTPQTSVTAKISKDIKKPSTKNMAELIRLNKTKDDLVYCYSYYYQDLPVYIRDMVGVVDFVGELEFGLHSDGGDKTGIRFLTKDKFWDMWNTTNKRIFLLLSLESYRNVFVDRKIKHRILGMDKHFIVIMNR